MRKVTVTIVAEYIGIRMHDPRAYMTQDVVVRMSQFPAVYLSTHVLPYQTRRACDQQRDIIFGYTI